MAKVDQPSEFRPPGMRVPPLAFSEVGNGRRFRFLRGSGRRGGTPALAVKPASLVVEPGGTSVSTHDFGYLFSALRRQGLIADELVLQLTTFLRSLDLFLELIVLTTSTLTANQVRHGGKQGTHNPELSCIHSSPPSIDFTPAKPPA